MDSLLLTALLGSVVGVVMALTGAGGGVLAVPLLIFGLHLTAQQAAPVAMLAVCAAALLGAALGLRERIVRYRAAALMGGLAMVMAPIGVWLAQRLPSKPLLIVFAVVLGWTAWRMFRLGGSTATGEPPAQRWLPCRVDVREGRLRWNAPCAWALGSTGVVAGLLAGLLGVGGGFVIVPALTRYTDLDTRSISATSLAVIALATLGGISAASRYGSPDWPLAGTFAGAALVALLVGRRLSQGLPVRTLQRSFAAVSAVVAVLMFSRGMGWLTA